MGIADVITRRTVGAYQSGSFSANARRRRWQDLAAAFPDIGDMKVLDVGGDARSWEIGGVCPGHVTLLNVGGVPEAPHSWMTGVEGDGCELPDGLGEFDLAFSNSVIEHVGGHLRRQQYAGNVRSAAPSYWIQTPYRYFPVEPHFLMPGMQFLPYKTQAWAVTHWRVGNFWMVDDPKVALECAMEIELLSKAQFAAYFPDAQLRAEKVGPFVKSWTAVRLA